MTIARHTIGVDAIASTPQEESTPQIAVVIGREYRLWINYPSEYTDATPSPIDFLVARVPGSTNVSTMLPIGALDRARFYYGNTVNGLTEADGDPTFRPLWQFPVSVALAATPWVQWGGGNYWQNGTLTAEDASLFGFANDPHNPHDVWSPAIGLMGQGTAILAMQLADSGDLDMPFPTILDRWFFHYSERGNVPQNVSTDGIEAIANGPTNPYALIAHQGRIVFPDNRRSAPAFALTSLATDHGKLDDLLFYSDHLLPMQNFADPPLDTDGGITNVAYGEFPKATMEPYQRQLVAEDIPAGFGTMGVVTIDQILLVKHKGGGALIAGDLDNPVHHRLPYIEPTRGVVCRGIHTPIGFVYGSTNGIFVWDGGDSTTRLSPQIDGFFWDHRQSANDRYSGQRGRMGFWNSMILVPNNFVFDLVSQSWWRLKVQNLEPVSPAPAPYNCYDVDEDDQMYAFGYRHAAPQFESGATFHGGSDSLVTPDISELDALTELDIRFAVRDALTVSGQRAVISQWDTDANDQCFAVRFNMNDELEFSWSLDGTNTSFVASDVQLTGSQVPMLGRVTWRSSDGRVQFFRKAPGDITKSMRSNNGWEQVGSDESGPTSALFNATDDILIGKLSDTDQSTMQGTFNAVSLATNINAPPVIEIIPTDFNIPDTDDSFTSTSGHVFTRTALVSWDRQLAATDTPPVWYTFDPDDLDSSYTWTSHPLLESRGRYLSFQSVTVLAQTNDYLNVDNGAPTIDVTLTGVDEQGDPATPVTTTLTLSTDDLEPQILRADITPNFNAAYVVVQLAASDPNDNPAPKIYSVDFNTRVRSRIPRHG